MVEEQTDIQSKHLWPRCGEEEVRIMLLGSYHMANPGLDEVNIEADDVLCRRRQTELDRLADRLVEWEPDRVAVEWPVDSQDNLTAGYESFCNGDRAYHRESDQPLEGDPILETRSEVVQIGFRVADRLGRGAVTAVDDHPDRSRYEPDPFEHNSVDSTRKTEVGFPDSGELKREREDRLASTTIPEYLAWLNQETQLLVSQEMMFDQALRLTDEPFGSPLALTVWYERNIRILHHIWRTMDSDDRRLLLVFGSGHITVLRHLMTDSPMFCPVSPLPLLPTPE